MLILLLFGALAAFGAVSTVVVVARDGYRAIPDRAQPRTLTDRSA